MHAQPQLCSIAMSAVRVCAACMQKNATGAGASAGLTSETVQRVSSRRGPNCIWAPFAERGSLGGGGAALLGELFFGLKPVLDIVPITSTAREVQFICSLANPCCNF